MRAAAADKVLAEKAVAGAEQLAAARTRAAATEMEVAKQARCSVGTEGWGQHRSIK